MTRRSDFYQEYTRSGSKFAISRQRTGVASLAAIVVLSINGLCLAGQMELRLRFVDTPAYQHCWLPWSKDHLRVAMEIRNDDTASYAIIKPRPCYDCRNPRIMVRCCATGSEPRRLRQMAIDYILNDSSYVFLASGESYVDTLDIEEYVSFDFLDGERYYVWFEYAPGPVYRFSDTLVTTPIWSGTMVSDTITFTVE